MFMGTDNDNVVYCPTEDLVLNSFYAYFEIPSLQGEETSVQDCVIDFDSVGIQEIKNDDLRYLEGWYNILGVKLYKKPTERGVYINNGKKVIIK